MDFQALGTWLSSEIDVLSHVSFWVVVGAVALVIWKVVQREYATRLANAESTISMLRDRLGHAERSETMAIAATGQVIEAKSERPHAHAARAELAGTSVLEVKEYVTDDFNPEAIFAALRDKNCLQAQNILIPEYGKWMRVKGLVRAASALAPDGGLLALHIEGTRELTFCTFRPVSHEVSALDINAIVEIEGKISRVTGNSLMLEDCVLLSSGTAAAAS
jgi:hypothetical protein